MAKTWKERYATDPVFREKQKARARKAYNREHHRLKTYGLSHEQFVEMYSRQNGRCDVCRDEMNPDGKKTCIDHDHDTGRVRAILCNNCNAALGMLREDLARIRALAEYVVRHTEAAD